MAINTRARVLRAMFEVATTTSPVRQRLLVECLVRDGEPSFRRVAMGYVGDEDLAVPAILKPLQNALGDPHLPPALRDKLRAK